MERLRREHGVDRCIGKRDRLGAAGERLGIRDDAFEHCTHALERLDGDHVRVSTHEHAGELAGARRQIEHGRFTRNRQKVEQLLRIGRTRGLVLLRGVVEALAPARSPAHRPERPCACRKRVLAVRDQLEEPAA